MRTAKILTVMIATAVSLSVSAPASIAATAHNSQAGGAGSSSNPCAATAYFPANTGCISSYIQKTQEGGDLLPQDARGGRYRPRPPLQ